MSMQYAHPSQYGYTSGINGFKMQEPSANFAFKKRYQAVDWKRIASLDVDMISRNLDFNALQENIVNVTYCNIEAELDSSMIDPNYIKLFKLAQFTIEYLLQSQDYLQGMLGGLEGRLKKAQEEHEATQRHLESLKEEITDVKKESHKRKKMLIAQQQIIQAGTHSYNKCPFCAKAFVNSTFLQSHMQRRHTEFTGSYNSMVASQVQQTTQAQQAPPLAVTPQSNFDQSAARSTLTADLEQELQEIKDRLKATEGQLIEERNARNSLSQRERDLIDSRDRGLQDEMKKWQQEQENVHKQELDKVRELFLRELNELSEKYDSSQNQLDSLQRRNGGNLGLIVDDFDNEKELLQKQREEVALLREQLHTSLEERLTEQSEQWKNKFNLLEDSYQQRLQKMNAMNQTKVEELNDESLHIDYQEHVEHIQLNDEADQQKEKKRAQKERSKAGKLAKEQAAREQALREQALREQAQREQAEREQADREQEELERIAVQREAASMKPTGVGQMMYDDDDDDETEADKTEVTENQTTEFDGTSTFTTTRGTMSMGQFGTSLSMAEPPSERLEKFLKKNPNYLAAIREEMIVKLEDELSKRGIKENSTGLTDKLYNNKLQLLKTERAVLADRVKNIYDIRQFYINIVEQQARDILKKQVLNRSSLMSAVPPQSKMLVRSKLPPRPKPPPKPQTPPKPHTPLRPEALLRTYTPRKPEAPPRPKTPPRRETSPRKITFLAAQKELKHGQRASASNQPVNPHAVKVPLRAKPQNQGERPKRPVSHPPVPAPRATSPTARQAATLPGYGGHVRNSMGSSMATTANSSNWDDDDDDDDGQPIAERPPVKIPAQTRSQSPVKNTRFAEDGSSEDDWDDSISDLEGDLEPTPGRSPPKTPVGKSPQPRGANVAQLSRSIEQQLSGRGRGKKPVGGVDTMKREDDLKPKPAARYYDDEDESLASVSSYDDDKAANARPVTRRGGTSATRSSVTDNDTNTYNTSIWGNSSRGAASTAHHPGSQNNTFTSKTSDGAGSDWDDEISSP